MPSTKQQFKTVDEYIRTFPPRVRTLLNDVRRTIRTAAPGAVDVISYQIPTFKLNGRILISFAAFRDHVGVYPAPAGTASFQKRLLPYRSGKATIRFPIHEPLPQGLVRQVVGFRIKEQKAGTGARPAASKRKT